VRPDLACALLRQSSLPSLKNGDPNQLCYFVFEPWPATSAPQSFDAWLFALITNLLANGNRSAPAQAPAGPASSNRELCVVYGPPGSGKTRWILNNYPNAKIFATPRLQESYPPHTATASPYLVVDEWQHQGVGMSTSRSHPIIKAIAGRWEKLIVIVDLGQARQDNKRWDAGTYDNIRKIVEMHQKAPISGSHIPLWIPVRQRQLGIAFMLWLEAVRRALTHRDTQQFANIWLSPDGAATGFKNARTLLVALGVESETLFDIRIIKRTQLERKSDGIHIEGIGRADIVLQRQRARNTDGDDDRPYTLPLRADKPVDVAGLEYENVIVNLEDDADYTSNEINEVLLACSRATRRLCLLVHEKNCSASSLIDPAQEALFDNYKLFGIGAFYSTAAR
jgi:hypothetical protein